MSKNPVLVCPDSFKGTLRATEVAAAIGAGLERAGLPQPDLCPVADGGEGTAEVLVTRLGGSTGGAQVTGPLGDPVMAGFALLDDGGAAVAEVAQASGLALSTKSAADAEAASTYGTGELILAAAAAGAQVVFVAAGGSATTDGGRGAIEAIETGGGLQGTRLVVLCDVRTPWERAADLFAPQKGADERAVARLSERLDSYAAELPRDPRGVPLTGAAGGLSGGLWAKYDAKLVPGAQFVLEELDFDKRMRAARCVITGEGHIDETSLQGKITGEIATRARQAGVPAHVICGELALDPFGVRILDLQVLAQAGTKPEIERAAAELGERLADGSA